MKNVGKPVVSMNAFLFLILIIIATVAGFYVGFAVGQGL